jgi:tetratricopeptide (TPR) repeat protein
MLRSARPLLQEEPCVTAHGEDHLAEGHRDVGAAEASAALERVCTSQAFRSAPQLTAFLRFIVQRTLEGRQHEIKGYTIAVEALGRRPDFDPIADPIVRVEAGRLRRAMESYYQGEGASDAVRFVVERGSYVPRIERREADAADHGPAPAEMPAPQASSVPAPPLPRPLDGRAGLKGRRRYVYGAVAASLLMLAIGVLAVVTSWRAAPSAAFADDGAITSAGRWLPVVRIETQPVRGDAGKLAVQRYGDSLADALSRFDEFVILEPDAAGLARAAASHLAYKLEFSGDMSDAGKLNGIIRLIHSPSGRIVWSSAIEQADSGPGEKGDPRESARRIAVRLAQPYGVIHAHLRTLNLAASPMSCLVRVYDYWTDPFEKAHAEARDCLERLVRSEPLFHPAHALLAMVHLDEFRIGYNPREGSALDRARVAAQRAISLAPESARSLQALMAVQTVSGDLETAVKTGFEAVRRNPFDTDILADVGARLTQAGRAREGRPLLLRAAELNVARPAWHDFYLFLSAREVGDAQGARAALASLISVDAPLALLARAVAASDAGNRGDSMAAIRRLAQISPIFQRDAGQFLDRAVFAPEVRSMLLGALRKGGLDEVKG